MARASWSMYQSYLGLPGNPIEYTDRYMLSDETPTSTPPAPETSLDFIHLNHRIADLTPRFQDIPPAMNPFPTAHCSRTTQLQFNVADYSRQLVNDFYIAGGKIETIEFHHPSDFAALPQKAIIHCTGYGAKSLFSDATLTPIRGQIGWLIPQPEVNYGFYYNQLNVLSRRDGIVVQPSEQGEATGWNDDNETPDRPAAEAAVRQLAALYARMPPRKS